METEAQVQEATNQQNGCPPCNHFNHNFNLSILDASKDTIFTDLYNLEGRSCGPEEIDGRSETCPWAADLTLYDSCQSPIGYKHFPAVFLAWANANGNQCIRLTSGVLWPEVCDSYKKNPLCFYQCSDGGEFLYLIT